MLTKKLQTSKPWNKYPCYCPVRIIYLAYNNKLRLNSDSPRTSSISPLDRFPSNGRFSVRRNRRIRRTLQFLRSNGLLASTPAQPLTTMTEARKSKKQQPFIFVLCKFHGEFKIFGEPTVLPPVLVMTEALNKAFLCRLFSVSCKQDASDYEQNTPEYTYQRNETVFSLRIGQTFFFKSFRKRFKAKSYISTA